MHRMFWKKNYNSFSTKRENPKLFSAVGANAQLGLAAKNNQ